LASVGVLGLGLLLAGCSSASSSPTTTLRPGTPSFYAVPSDALSHPVGSLIKSQKVTIPGIHGTSYRVMYVSTGIGSKPAVVTGLLVIPDTMAPSGGFPVVSWGHGTNGMAFQCAPSLDPNNADQLSIGIDPVNALLAKGWAVAASDYQGEGSPPGLLPYLVGELAAQNTIDIVRAVHQISDAHTSLNYIVWGHSEGGQTAMFAWNLAQTYGARGGLKMLGVVAGAPPSQFKYIYDALQTSPYRFYLYMAAKGFNLYYGSEKAPLAQVLTPLGLSKQAVVSGGCFTYVENQLDKYTITQLVKADPFTLSSWKPLLEANDPGNFTSAPSTPLLLIQGGSDEQIPVASTALLDAHLCSLPGAHVQRWIYPGKSHTGVIPVSTTDMVTWMDQLLSGSSLFDAPSGQSDIQKSSCG
jgi:pimeloyl-ACP methyl ester carboxylesterase